MARFQERIACLQDRIRERDLSGAMTHASRDIYYYTGTAQPGWLVVLPSDAFLFVRAGLDFAQTQSALSGDRILREGSLERIVSSVFGHNTAGLVIGAELDLMTVPQYRKLQEQLHDTRLVDISSDILDQRMIKDSKEVAAIELATAALDAGHRAAVENWRPGISELEASAFVEDGQRRAGHEGVYFVRQPDFTMGRGPLASGENIGRISGVVFTISGCGLSAAVPAGAGRRSIRAGDLVIVDIPTCVQGYHGDQTRTYCMGRPSDETARLYERLRDVADGLIADILPGMSSGDVFARACFHADRLGLHDAFLKFPDGKQAHFVGHGVGLDLNEPPFLSRGGREPIREGMILAVELHVCDEQAGMVKLEDMVLVGRDGCRLLTHSPRELIEISC
ncbi:aminopeptidase P family protein [Limibaculum sp. M0105]|uniref:Aminopeptidase P family protein n=1 Tax=Thermohalobaculum xanthum TaxID=2753746 RepID=A0A8J7SD73_9RHOB|nr:Xaa-Pro peptidase family protein [Thermohalobaculum xanthum]MBK0398262.1 aminopeptidase P family protein [Thermohalobaculum xanthum]